MGGKRIPIIISETIQTAKTIKETEILSPKGTINKTIDDVLKTTKDVTGIDKINTAMRKKTTDEEKEKSGEYEQIYSLALNKKVWVKKVWANK